MDNSFLILGYHSAYLFWVHCDEPDLLMPISAKGPLVGVCVTAHAEAYRALVRDLAFKSPIHFLVSADGSVRQSNSVVYHALVAGPDASDFLRVNAEVCVCAPWLCLVQLAERCSIVQLAFFSLSLCASYRLPRESRELIELDAPALTVVSLTAKIQSHRSLRGASRALVALKFAVEGSRSPMESKTMLVLCLPYKYGGFGLPLPVLNQQILPGLLRPIVNQSYFEGDLCWPEQKVIVEYNGHDTHPDFVKDAARFSSLEALGWKVFFLDRERINSAIFVETMALQIAHCLGKRIRRPEGWVQRHADLRKELGLRNDRDDYGDYGASVSSFAR